MNRFQYTEIDEPVKVGAVFDRARISPRWFVWKDRKYSLRKITYEWIDSRGASRILCYAVWDGSNVYELSLNLSLLSWRLDKIYIE